MQKVTFLAVLTLYNWWVIFCQQQSVFKLKLLIKSDFKKLELFYLQVLFMAYKYMMLYLTCFRKKNSMHYKKAHAFASAMKFRKPDVMELSCSLLIDQVTEIQSSNAFNKGHSERNIVLINTSSEGYSKYIINCQALIQFTYIFQCLSLW